MRKNFKAEVLLFNVMKLLFFLNEASKEDRLRRHVFVMVDTTTHEDTNAHTTFSF